MKFSPMKWECSFPSVLVNLTVAEAGKLQNPADFFSPGDPSYASGTSANSSRNKTLEDSLVWHGADRGQRRYIVENIQLVLCWQGWPGSFLQPASLMNSNSINCPWHLNNLKHPGPTNCNTRSW